MTVRARAIAVGLTAMASVGCHAILGPTEIDANWRVIDTPRFTFNVRPGSFAEQSVATLQTVLDDQYDATQRALDIRYAGKVSLFLYDSAADANMQADRSGMAFPMTESVRAVCVPPLDGNLFALLSHEANHVIQLNAIGRAGTYLLAEGLPSAVLSERYHQYGATFLYSWTATNVGRIPPITELVDDDRWGGWDEQVAYKASASFLAYLLETSGAERLKQLQPLPSSEFAGRFQQLYGRSLDQADRDWRAFCAARAR